MPPTVDKLLRVCVELGQPLAGQPFHQLRNRPGCRAVQVGAALAHHRGDNRQWVHRAHRTRCVGQYGNLKECGQIGSA